MGNEELNDSFWANLIGGGGSFDAGSIDPGLLSQLDMGDFSNMDLGQLDIGDVLSNIDSGLLDQLNAGDFSNMDLGQLDIGDALQELGTSASDSDLLAKLDAGNFSGMDLSQPDIANILADLGGSTSGYYDETTGEFIPDPSGGLRGPLDEKSGTNIESMKDYTYDPKSGTWTMPSGETYTPSVAPSGTAKSGAQVMVNAGALPKGYAGLTPDKGSTADLMAGKPGWSSNVKDAAKAAAQATKTGTQQKSGLDALLPLLLMLLAMGQGRGSSGSSNAVIPALTATRRQTPYSAIQRAPGYRPGQGGITYFEPTQYAPRMATGGIADLERGRLLDGPGDGVSDSIPATIGGMAGGGQPARLARGEYVIDARTVAALGNGSTDAGAERLDEMRRKILADDRKAGIGKDSKAYRHLA